MWAAIKKAAPSLVADTFSTFTSGISNYLVKGTIEEGEKSAKNVNKDVQKTVSQVDRGAKETVEQARATVAYASEESKELIGHANGTIAFGRECALELNENVQETIRMSKRSALEVNDRVQDTVVLVKDSAVEIAGTVTDTAHVVRDAALDVNAGVQDTVSLARHETIAVMRDADDIVSTNTHTVLTLTGKACCIYLTMIVAGYIQMEYYKVEMLQIVFSLPYMLTPSALFIEYQWKYVFNSLAVITVLFICGPAIITLCWLLYCLSLTPIWWTFKVVCLLFGIMQQFAYISLVAFFGPLALIFLFCGLFCLLFILEN